MKLKKPKSKKGIYKITNPKNEVYIGQTVDWNDRKRRYLNFRVKGQPKILKSLLQYGPENHVFEFIKEYKLNQLDQKETYYKTKFVKKYGWKKALFCRLNDGKGGHLSKETKQKIGDSNRKPKPKGFGEKLSKLKMGIKQSQETKDKRSKATKGNPKPKGFGNMISKIMMGKPKYKTRKPILQYDKQGNFIKEWDSTKQAAKKLKTSNTNIWSCLNNKQPTAANYIWKYK